MIATGSRDRNLSVRMDQKINILTYNTLSNEEKNKLINFIFEDSPWVVNNAMLKSEFDSQKSVHALFDVILSSLNEASHEDKLKLLVAHPDLVGKAALSGIFRKFISSSCIYI